jgi:hypothetical protein
MSKPFNLAADIN